jgi:hypothetical protein
MGGPGPLAPAGTGRKIMTGIHEATVEALTAEDVDPLEGRGE